jgi:hypothetical protein
MTDRVELNNGLTDSLGTISFAFVGRSTPVYIQDSGSSSGNIQSIEIAAMSIPAAIQDIGTDVDNKGLAGFDTIFSPYTTASEHSELPHFEDPINLTEPNSYTLDPFNPNNMFETVVSQTINNDKFARSGHNIQIANTWQAAGPGTIGDASFVKDLYENGTFTYDGVKSIGLRAPMVLSGWGYDTDQKPVPADTGNPNIFASGAFRNPNIWKTGPVDLRWDNDRKVWSAGTGGSDIVLFTITDSEECGTGCVDATVTLRACGLNSPDAGETIVVEDEAGCFFNVDPVLLLGLKGFAIKMEDPGSCNPYSTEDCHWVVFSMCCAVGGCP